MKIAINNTVSLCVSKDKFAGWTLRLFTLLSSSKNFPRKIISQRLHKFRVNVIGDEAYTRREATKINIIDLSRRRYQSPAEKKFQSSEICKKNLLQSCRRNLFREENFISDLFFCDLFIKFERLRPLLGLEAEKTSLRTARDKIPPYQWRPAFVESIFKHDSRLHAQRQLR